MARSDYYRTRAEECRARAETSFTPEAWLKLAATWLALIPVSREAASERSKAKQPVGADGENTLKIGSTPHSIAAGGKPSPITQVDPTTARAAQPGGVDALDVGLVVCGLKNRLKICGLCAPVQHGARRLGGNNRGGWKGGYGPPRQRTGDRLIKSQRAASVL
jgi:hypothetical protein